MTTISSSLTSFPKNLANPSFPKPSHNLKFTTHNLKPPPPLSLLLKPKSKSKFITSLFTGIVEDMGEVRHVGPSDDGGFTMTIHTKTLLEDVNLGDSISVNGTCLTVTRFDTGLGEFVVGLSPETLRKTSLVELENGSLVNLERALKPSTRMGGHFVQGHVDGTGVIAEKEREGDSLWLKVQSSKFLNNLLCETKSHIA